MSDPLFGIDHREGMFKRYEMPLLFLCSMPPISGDDFLSNLVLEAQRRLRQLDRFYEETWACVHRVVAVRPGMERTEAGTIEASRVRMGAMDEASDAAEAFYLFGFRVFDITRTLAKRVCGTDLRIPEPRSFMAVRNHLLVHPEKHPGKVLSWSVYVTNEDNRGVVLKNQRLDAEKRGMRTPGLDRTPLNYNPTLKTGS